MDYVKYIFTLVILFVVGMLYDKYKVRFDNEDTKHYDIVRQHLLNGDSSSLAQNKKPIIWIHTSYEVNSNNWASFGSRNNKSTNQPYKHITIKSIVDKCGDDFNICMINDSSFAKIVPGWNIDMKTLADPIKSNIRRLAIARLLKTFGGMIVPGSMICLKSFKELYDEGIQGGGMFVGEITNSGARSSSRNPNILYPTTLFMGCKQECSTMKDYERYLEKLNSTDYTDESKFLGDDAEWCLGKIAKCEMKLIPGKLLGARDGNGAVMTLEELLGNSYVDIESDAFGIYIPDEEILRRTKYQWFARLSPGQALASDTNIGKYLVLASSNSCVEDS